MGIRDIQRKIRMKEEMRKKALELRAKEIESRTRVENWARDRLRQIAQKHGLLVALDPETRAIVEELRLEYNIPKSRIITEEVTEEMVLGKRGKVDLEKLGMLAYQRVLFEKSETGGLLTVPEVFSRVNTGALVGRVTLDDVTRAVRLLAKKKVISSVQEMENGVVLVSFFPVQYTEDHNRVLEVAAGKGWTTLEEVCTKLDWNEERALRALKRLEASGAARLDESYRTGRKWYFPNL